MKDFKINGLDRTPPLPAHESFNSLIEFIHSNLVNENSLISSFKVNGTEITEDDERALATTPLSQIESVEIDFAHPREVAEETLQNLLTFTLQLIDLSKKVAAEIGSQQSDRDFQALLDGIQTFTDTIIQVRKILKIGIMPSINLLEADLLSILKDLLQTHYSKDITYRVNLLHEYLPENLERWRTSGIPLIIRSRDS